MALQQGSPLQVGIRANLNNTRGSRYLIFVAWYGFGTDRAPYWVLGSFENKHPPSRLCATEEAAKHPAACGHVLAWAASHLRGRVSN